MKERDRWGSYWVRDGERDREREGGVKQMYQNCIPTMNMNTLCDLRITSIHFCQFMKRNKR